MQSTGSIINIVCILLLVSLFAVEFLLPSFVSAYVDVNILLVVFCGYVFLVLANRTSEEEG